MAIEEGSMQLHIAVFPWLAFGHMIPFLELARLLAEKGHKISYISTPRNIARLQKIPTHLKPLLNFVQLPLPQSDNLPPEAESTNDLPPHKVSYLKIAYDSLEHGLAHFLEISRPDWIIYDFAPYWLPPIAAKLGILRAHFSILWALSYCIFASSSSSMINGDDSRSKPEDFTVSPPWVPFPSKVAFRIHEAKKFAAMASCVNESGVSDFFRAGTVLAGCDVLAMRSCPEVEHQWLNLVAKLYQKEVVPVGLLPQSADAGGEDDDGTWLTIKKWLERQDEGSVVFVAFGSEVSLSQEELNELALGLELSGFPFFWALKKGKEESTAVLPDGFEERNKGRGVVWTGWAPQLRILAHESVGGFLTHCGWSSVIEGLQFGRPLIMLPMQLDQGLIARVFGEEKEAGIEIPRNDEDGSFTRSSVAESLRLVMMDNKGQTYRNNAKELMKIYGDKRLHDQYVDRFIECLQNHIRAKED